MPTDDTHPLQADSRASASRFRLALGALALLVVLGLALLLPWTGWSWEVWVTLRGPRVVAGAVVGALLALSGLALQILLRNPLADPYVLGTSGGAVVGALLPQTLAALLGLHVLAAVPLGLGAALGAVAAGVLLLALARGALKAREDDASSRLILAGAMLAALLGAVGTLLLMLTPDQRLRGSLFWLVGDLSGASDALWAVPVVLLALAYFVWRARALDRLLLGTEVAWLLGEPVRRLRHELLVLAALATACAVALAGAVGFVGLVVPQALRAAGVRHTAALAGMSALGGAALVAWADALARTLAWPLELPVGVVMALIGAPMFIFFLARGAK